MIDTKYLVLHMDDEPEWASSIPRGISSWFWKHFPNDMRGLEDDYWENDDETEFNLALRACDSVLNTHYRICLDPATLTSKLASVSRETVVMVLLDQRIGSNHKAGGETYMHITATWPDLLLRTAIYSAYPEYVIAQLGWQIHDKRLIMKSDVDSNHKVISTFINNLASVAALSTLARERLTAAAAF
jgi:hypothetical protein